MTDTVEVTDAKDEGATFVLSKLAECLGVDDWSIQDGTESWSGDVESTMHHILVKANVIDDWDGSVARHATTRQHEAQVEGLVEAAKEDLAMAVSEIAGVRGRLEAIASCNEDRRLAAAQGVVEEIGICIGCNQWLRAGEVVTPWDDEVGHADCKNPTSLTFPPLPDDCPPAMVLLGNPARYLPVEKALAALKASSDD